MNPRILRAAITSIPLCFVLACGSTPKSGGGGGSGAPAGAPAWVNAGNRIKSGSIFGVGAITGSNKNIALARDAAANRGRAEISRVLETYSTSLMKDYQRAVTAGDFTATDNEQMVEQAIKTYSSQLLKGSETKEYWTDQAGNTLFALVELNFERSREVAAAAAEMGTSMKKWVEENEERVLGELEEETDSRPPVVAKADDSGSGGGTTTSKPPPPPKADPGPAATKGGPAPGWTQGNCDRNKYLCGVGSGNKQKAADIAARTELAMIFKANVASVAKSFEGYASKVSSTTGENWTSVSKISAFSMVSTDKVVTMSEILYRWDDAKGTLWALAVINRAQASNAIRDQIQEKDSLVTSKLGIARGTNDKVKRLKALKGAVLAMLERSALNGDLRVIDKSGRGIPSPHNMADILALAEGAAEDLSLGIAISGSGAQRVQDCLEEKLTDKGYQIESNIEEDEDDEIDISGSFDVLIKGVVKNEKRGKIAGGQVVQTSVTLKLINGKTKKVLRTFRGSQKGTRKSVKAAASTSAAKICYKQVPKIVKDIERYFSK